MLLAISSEQITYIGVIGLSLVLMAICIYLHFHFKKQNASRLNSNTTDQGVWAFTKRHFWSYAAIFFSIPWITCLIMLIQTL